MSTVEESLLKPVRLKAPYSMECTACETSIIQGHKINARKVKTDEKYNDIAIYRFHIECARCSQEITFKTDPKNMDYQAEKGANRVSRLDTRTS